MVRFISAPMQRGVCFLQLNRAVQIHSQWRKPMLEYATIWATNTTGKSSYGKAAGHDLQRGIMILALAMGHTVERPAIRMGGGTKILWSGFACRCLFCLWKKLHHGKFLLRFDKLLCRFLFSKFDKICRKCDNYCRIMSFSAPWKMNIVSFIKVLSGCLTWMGVW